MGAEDHMRIPPTMTGAEAAPVHARLLQPEGHRRVQEGIRDREGGQVHLGHNAPGGVSRHIGGQQG